MGGEGRTPLGSTFLSVKSRSGAVRIVERRLVPLGDLLECSPGMEIPKAHDLKIANFLMHPIPGLVYMELLGPSCRWPSL